jgi:hypothetical protein
MSPQWTFNVSWKRTCLTCHHPIDVIITITSHHDYDTFWRRYVNLSDLRPSTMDLNDCMYKIINLKAYRMCKSCYDAKAHKISFKSLMNRELYGTKLCPKSNSLSAEQIYNWFESFNRYLHRPDADDYVVQRPLLES